MSYNGWLLPENERARLLALFPPLYPDVVAHHVTLQFPATETDPLPLETKGVVVGMAEDGNGVQALVLAIGGATSRPSGGTYHITWSLDRSKGAKPVDSNKLLEAGWDDVPRISVRLEPTFFGDS